jgi:hypothetical protein
MSTYVYEFKPNNKVCDGLVADAADITALYKGEMTPVDYMAK